MVSISERANQSKGGQIRNSALCKEKLRSHVGSIQKPNVMQYNMASHLANKILRIIIIIIILPGTKTSPYQTEAL